MVELPREWPVTHTPTVYSDVMFRERLSTKHSKKPCSTWTFLASESGWAGHLTMSVSTWLIAIACTALWSKADRGSSNSRSSGERMGPPSDRGPAAEDASVHKAFAAKRRCQYLWVERLDAAAHRAKQVVERALWDYDYRWGSPRDSGWIIIGSSTLMRVGGKAADKECRPALPMMG